MSSRTLRIAGPAALILAAVAVRAQAPAGGTKPMPSGLNLLRAESAAPAQGPSAAVVEKLAAGDRAYAIGDFRTALFAYEDACYLQPGYLKSRVKMGRAFLALRYPDRAAQQAELVLASDPSNPEAAALLDEARKAPPRGTAQGAAAPTVIDPNAKPPPQRVLKLATAAPVAAAATPAPAGAPGAAAASPAGAAPAGGAPAVAAGAGVASAAAAPTREPAPTKEPAAVVPTAPGQPGMTAAQRYRAGLDLMSKRDWAGAVTELTEAIALDPRLAVAYSARASARFGLGKYREAADDYKAALGLDPGLGTPLYGLAECYRLLGDPAAAEYYQRYADSKASDVRDDLRAISAKRAQELSGK